MPETIAAVEQGTCTNCEKSGDNWRQVQRDFSSNGVDRLLLCDCDSRSVVRLSSDGLTTAGSISHKDASWNQESDSDE